MVEDRLTEYPRCGEISHHTLNQALEGVVLGERGWSWERESGPVDLEERGWS